MKRWDEGAAAPRRHNTQVRKGNKDIPLIITVGLAFRGHIRPLAMRFGSQGDELVYCNPVENGARDLGLIAHGASLRVESLYPMSGVDTEDPVLQPGRIGVLLGQGAPPTCRATSVWRWSNPRPMTGAVS